MGAVTVTEDSLSPFPSTLMLLSVNAGAVCPLWPPSENAFSVNIHLNMESLL